MIIRKLQLNLIFYGLSLCAVQPLFAEEKTHQTEQNSETIIISETLYTIPEPWAGNSIAAPYLPMKAFDQIPVDHTKNGSSLYIVKEAHSALSKLLEAAKKDGIILKAESGYRSPGYQKKIFSRMLSEGRKFDDIIRYVAPPGYSQHALGTAVDFFPSNWEFASLPDYQWLQKYGAQFGFTETYPRNNSLRYPWEAWHWNYSSTAKHEIRSQIEQQSTVHPPQG